ncbi:MAG: hypothetical protein ABEL76_12430 [Bradymonadaceae bacterium]
MNDDFSDGDDRAELARRTEREIERQLEEMREELRREFLDYERRLSTTVRSVPSWEEVDPDDVEELFVVELPGQRGHAKLGPRSVAVAAGELESFATHWLAEVGRGNEPGLDTGQIDEVERRAAVLSDLLRTLGDLIHRRADAAEEFVENQREATLERLEEQREETLADVESRVRDGELEPGAGARDERARAWDKQRKKAGETRAYWADIEELIEEGRRSADEGLSELRALFDRAVSGLCGSRPELGDRLPEPFDDSVDASSDGGEAEGGHPTEPVDVDAGVAGGPRPPGPPSASESRPGVDSGHDPGGAEPGDSAGASEPSEGAAAFAEPSDEPEPSTPWSDPSAVDSESRAAVGTDASKAEGTDEGFEVPASDLEDPEPAVGGADDGPATMPAVGASGSPEEEQPDESSGVDESRPAGGEVEPAAEEVEPGGDVDAQSDDGDETDENGDAAGEDDGDRAEGRAIRLRTSERPVPLPQVAYALGPPFVVLVAVAVAALLRVVGLGWMFASFLAWSWVEPVVAVSAIWCVFGPVILRWRPRFDGWRPYFARDVEVREEADLRVDADGLYLDEQRIDADEIARGDLKRWGRDGAGEMFGWLLALDPPGGELTFVSPAADLESWQASNAPVVEPPGEAWQIESDVFDEFRRWVDDDGR